MVYPGKRFNLKWKMIVSISVLVIGICVIFGLFLHSFISKTMEEQIGKRALSVSQSVANMPEIQAAFELENPASVIQKVVLPIQQQTGAEFIVVGNTKGIRYSHPDPDKLGKKMVGGDNERALSGESYTSKRVDSLGLSIRGKTPIYDKNGKVIGVVSVGFLNNDVQHIIQRQSKSVWITLAGVVLVGIIGAIVISIYLKRLLSGMEPEEISQVLLQKEAILQSTHEGLIAVNETGMVTMINAAAQRILFHQTVSDDRYTGRPIQEILPHTGLFAVLKNGESHYNREMVLGDTVVLVNRMPIFRHHIIVGAVATFREKTELEHVTNELLQIKQYANAQRAQTHEFSNKLYTILGLLQLDQTDEAIAFIKKESDSQLGWSEFLVKHIADPMVQGLLQGKINQANELGITMSIDPDSQLTTRFKGDKQDALLTAVGNLIENAMDALKQNPDDQREIAIFFTDIGEDVILEVDDSGSGISMDEAPHIFDQGYSTKQGSHRGTGLALTKHRLQEVNGTIMLEEGDLGGACFIVIIPKDEGDNNV